MRVGLVRSVALGMVALVGFAGCDDNPTDFDTSDTTAITTNPSVMTVNAEETALLDSRTINAGDEPTWEEISPSVDGSCGHSDISVAVAETYEPSIQPPGQFDVTAGTTLGESCIQLSGGGASATVEVTVVPDSLDITNVPVDVVVFNTVQLGGTLLGDDGGTVGPFDFGADVVWASDDSTVAVVDETGLLTATGAGSATITATWTGSGVSREYEFPVNVVVPPPALTSTDAGSYEYGSVVTVTGTGFIDGAHGIFVNGIAVSDVLEPTIVNETTATFRMPGAPAPGSVDIQVGVAGDLSNAVQADRIVESDEDANDATATAPMVTFPVDRWGYVEGGADVEFYQFTLAAETTFSLFLNWDSSADMDLYVTDAAFAFALCGFAAGTADQPEDGECTLAAGTYWLAVVSYDGAAGTWHMLVDEVTP